ncbi:MAG: hypothetical protein ABW124_03705 [Candidatus Thiodiazotropha sp. 6PLUC9]
MNTTMGAINNAAITASNSIVISIILARTLPYMAALGNNLNC